MKPRLSTTRRLHRATATAAAALLLALAAGLLGPAAACRAAQPRVAVPPPPPPPAPARDDMTLAEARFAGGPPSARTSATSAAVDAASTFDLYALPASYRRGDGSFNQDALVTAQKRRLDPINKRLGARFTLTETPHYLVFSDTDAKTTAQFVEWSELLYRNLGRQFGIDAKERIWDGKCVLILFHTRARFEAYAKAFDEHSATEAGAYFALEGYPAGEPQLVHMCIPIESRDVRWLQELFAHEGTHAFFELYKKPGGLPLWLHEGLAEYMTVVNDPTLRASKIAPALRLGRNEDLVRRVLAARRPGDLSTDGYSVAFALVEQLVSSGPPKFKKFIETLKQGTPADQALRDAYGLSQPDLVAQWRQTLTFNAPAPR